MDDPSSRIYCEIIDRVYSSLLHDGPVVGLDHSLATALRDDWIKNIERLQNEAPLLIEEARDVSEDSFSSTSYITDGRVRPEDDLDKLEGMISSYVVCLFAKVAKSKNKWKCSFKHGFILIDNMDIPFNTANGELEW